MPLFCDVAVPVPLDATFTYRVGDTVPVMGGRVLVPFRTTRIAGIVTALHDNPPSMTAKSIITVMDAVPSFHRNCITILASLETETRRRLLDNNLRLLLSASETLRADIPRAWQKEFVLD